MKVEQLFTGCLAEMAYYISDNGEAAIIDPLRETAPYIEMAEADGAKIKWIFLTHFHADFVSGQVDLAKKTGATIVFGPNATANYDFHQGKDGELFPIGNINLKLIHTPGHTMESSSYVLIDEKGDTPYLFSGDALFIGDVGRPDLAVKQGVLTETDLAGYLFDSLRNKIMTLPDDIIVYPNHGAGSACGKNMSSETFDTLGNQKKTNYALRADMTKEEFVKEVITGLTTPPQYFPKAVGKNKGVNLEIDEIIANGTKALSADEFESRMKAGVLTLDTRSKEAFIAEHVPSAMFVGLDGSFATWVGTLVMDVNTEIIFIAEEGREAEVVTRLARVGYDNAQGYLEGGIEAWKAAGKETESVGSVTAEEFATIINEGGDFVALDVRRKSEYDSEHVIGVENFPLDWINRELENLDKSKKYYLHCASGYRSLVAASLFKANGIDNVVDVAGGFGDLKNTDVPMTEYVCPTTLL